MATLSGTLKLRGSVDNLTFCKYRQIKRPVVKKKKEKMSKDYYEKSPTMAVVRKHNTEFTLVSQTASVFNKVLGFVYRDYDRGYLYQRMTRLFMNVTKCDISQDHGNRTMAGGLVQPKGRRLLKGFQFTPQVERFDFYEGTAVFDYDSYEFGIKGMESVASGLTDADAVVFQVMVFGFNFNEQRGELTYSSRLTLYKGTEFSGDLKLKCKPLKNSWDSYFVFLNYKGLIRTGGKNYELKGKKNFGLELVDFRVV